MSKSGAAYSRAAEPSTSRIMASANLIQSLTAGEVEIQKMLADERARCEQHKVNYLTLKEEHTKLQEEYLSLQREMKQTLEQSKQMKENAELSLTKAYKLIEEKQVELDGLKAKLDAYNIEGLKQKIQEEVEQHYKEWSERLESEVDSYREKYNQLHYEHTVAKCQLQYAETEHKQILEELKIKHEIEIRELQNERDVLLQQQNSEGEKDSLRLRNLQRENSQLTLKIKGLLTELEELQAQREKAGLHAENVSRIQSRQLAEHTANIRTLESEKTTLQMQKEALQRELSTCSEDQKSLASQLHAAKNEILKLKRQLEEMEHKANIEATNLQIEGVRKKAEVERERDMIAAEVVNLKLDLEMARETTDKHKQLIKEMEQEMQKKVHAACQQVWEQYHQLNSEKGRLESNLKEVEKEKGEKETVLQYELEKVKQKLKVVTDSKSSLEEELTLIKIKYEESHNKSQSIKNTVQENSSLKEEIYQLRKENADLTSFQNELLQQREKLKNAAAELHKKLEAITSESHKSKELEQSSLIHQQMNLQQEKQQYQHRIEQLESQIRDSNDKTTRESQELKNKLRKYARLITKLRDRMELQKVRMDDMEVENEMLKKNVPQEVHMQLKKQLKDLQRRHEEFNQIMAATLTHAPMNDSQNENFSIGASLVPHFREPPLSSTLKQDAMDNTELKSLKNRLDLLEEQQQLQLKELEQFTSRLSFPSKAELKTDGSEISSLSDLEDNL